MLVLSHRGYHVSARENTLEAFDQAVALGVDGIETDVRLSADGIPVLFHDRLVKGPRAVASLTHAELSRCVNHDVPTLEGALDRFPNVLWNVEIKVPEALEATVAVLTRFLPARRVLITSFWHPLVEEACRRLDVEGGVLVAHCPRREINPADWPGHARARTIVWDWETCDRAMLATAASQGLRNFVYGPATAEELAEISTWPIDGVITDRPDLLQGRR